MALDALGRDAAAQLRSLTEDLDVERPLAAAVAPATRRWYPRVALIAAVTLLVAWLAGGGDLLGGRHTAPPVQQPPGPVIGHALIAPVEFRAPAGWHVLRDDDVVELTPSDGSAGKITIVVPERIYDPVSHEAALLEEDPVVWTAVHPDLTSTRWSLDGPDFAWYGSAMRLEIASPTDAASVPLVELPDAGGGGRPLAVTSDDATFLWDVIYVPEEPPLVIASRSPVSDDPALQSVRNELLASLVITSTPTDQESS